MSKIMKYETPVSHAFDRWLRQVGVGHDVALVLHHKNGAEVSLRKSGQAFFDEQGSFLGTIEFLRDASVASESADSVSVKKKIPSPRRWPGRPFVAFHGMSSADSRMREIFFG